MIWGGCLSLPGCTVSVLATEDVSPGQDSHLLTMDVLSPAREGGLPEAGRVTAWELGAHSPPLAEAQHQLSHSPAQVGMANMASMQGNPKGLGDPAGLTWGTAGEVAGEPLTQHHQHPATLAGMAAEAPWPSSSSSQSLFGTIPLVLECSPMHTSSPPLILRAKLAWGSANPAKSSPGTLSCNSLLPHPTLQHAHSGPGWQQDGSRHGHQCCSSWHG